MKIRLKRLLSLWEPKDLKNQNLTELIMKPELIPYIKVLIFDKLILSNIDELISNHYLEPKMEKIEIKSSEFKTYNDDEL
jgi:hypothetical protein